MASQVASALGKVAFGGFALIEKAKDFRPEQEMMGERPPVASAERIRDMERAEDIGRLERARRGDRQVVAFVDRTEKCRAEN